MKCKIIILIIILCTAFLSAQEYERIVDFHSDIFIYKDGTMMVAERIQVVSTGNEIRRGIYRDFPTRYRTPDGRWYVVEFELLDVLRDGSPEEHRLENYSNGLRIYIGNANIYLDPGIYTYTITYRTNRQIGFFKDHDELFWNVTGNGWAFPIEKASASVSLPYEVHKKILKYDGYTGYQGDREKDFNAYIRNSKEIYFETISSLSPNQGLSIVVSWQKGLIPPPTLSQKASYFYQDNLALLIGFLGFLCVLVFYLFDWLKHGKDPVKGAIYPLFHPPDGMSPASIRYISNKGYDDKAMTAALVNMAVKGHIHISEDDDTFSISHQQNSVKKLTRDESEIAKELFATDQQIELRNSNHVIIHNAIDVLKNTLKKQYYNVYFRTNRKYFIFGAILSAVILAVNLFFYPDKAVFGVAFWLAGWSVGTGFLLFSSINGWLHVLVSKKIRSFVSAVIMTFFCLPFIAGEIFGIVLLVKTTSVLWVFIFLGIILLNILFYHLLETFTPKGRSFMDQVEGFRMFLSVSEKDRIHMLNPQAKTIELFEQYLPYAIALDVEQQWSDQFTDILSDSLQQPTTSGVSRWYSNSSSHINIGSFMSSLGSSFSSSISSSSHAPGSHSGIGGGGSSGGGGGGGGGGGW